MTRPRSLPRSPRAPQAAGLLAFGLLAGAPLRATRADEPPARPASACADAFEASTPLRRLEPTHEVLLVAGRPTVLRLPAGTGPCVAFVAETSDPIDLGLAIHAADGEVLAEPAPGPTSAAVACAQPLEVRYAVLRAPTTLRVAITRLAGPEPGASPPAPCAANTPSSRRGEIDPGGPPGASDAAAGPSTVEPGATGLRGRESHRVQSIGGLAVPVPIDVHAGRALALEVESETHATLRLVDPSGRVVASDATRSGVARVFVHPASDERLRAYVRGASPSTLRVFEAPP